MPARVAGHSRRLPLLILSDRGIDEEYAPIPSLLALTAVHNHLVRERTRTQVALIIESGEPREVMHFALLIGYGASADQSVSGDRNAGGHGAEAAAWRSDVRAALKNYKKAINKGLLKVFSKMGISTLQSYRGAQMLRGHRAEQRAGRSLFHRAPPRASKASAWTCWRARRR